MSRPTMPAPTACFRSPSASTISWTWSASSSAIASTKKCGCRRSWLAGPDPPSRRIPHHRIAAPIIAPVSTITVGGSLVGDDAPTYVIAEIGSNHDGSLDEAVRLIEAAAGAGADCIKFQAFRAETLGAALHPRAPGSEGGCRSMRRPLHGHTLRSGGSSGPGRSWSAAAQDRLGRSHLYGPARGRRRHRTTTRRQHG